jgi:hypothetical protein
LKSPGSISREILPGVSPERFLVKSLLEWSISWNGVSPEMDRGVSPEMDRFLE